MSRDKQQQQTNYDFMELERKRLQHLQSQSAAIDKRIREVEERKEKEEKEARDAATMAEFLAKKQQDKKEDEMEVRLRRSLINNYEDAIKTGDQKMINLAQAKVMANKQG